MINPTSKVVDNCERCRALRVFSTKYPHSGYAPSEEPIELTVSDTAVEPKNKIKFTANIWDAESVEQDNVFYLNTEKSS
mgnify:FL=1|jgi:hypothetical protein